MGTSEDEDRIAALLRLAGERSNADEARAARVRSAVHAEWRTSVERRPTRLRWVWAAAAAAFVAAVFWTLIETTGWNAPPASGPAGFVQAATNRNLRVDDPIPAGTLIETASDQAAIRLTSGPSVRLDAGTGLRVVSATELVLERGAVYVDSGAGRAAPGPALTIHTGFGDVRDIGTQFEIRLADAAIAVRVREGRVLLDRQGRSYEAGRGAEMVVDSTGQVVQRTVRTDGPEWNWTLSIRPPFVLQGHTLDEFLEWVVRESGRRLAFDEPRIEVSAPDVVLSGSIEGLTPDEALAAVLPTCGLTHRIEDERLIVMASNFTAVRDVD